MTDAARVLLTATVLAALSIGAFAQRLLGLERDSALRLVGELRLANAAALLLAVTGGVYVGLAVAARTNPASGLDVAISVAVIVTAAIALLREPRESLLLCAIAFAAHAVVDIAHRPGLLNAALVPHWYLTGCAVFNVYVAAICFLVRRR